MKDLQKLNTYHLTTNWPFHQATYAPNNNFQTFLITMILLICNETLYCDKVSTRIYMNQIFGSFLSAILRQSIFLLPYKSLHEPFCVERVLILDCCRLHCKRLNLLVLSLPPWVFHQVANQIGMIGSILPMCTQNLVSDQKHIAWLTRNNQWKVEHYTVNHQVNDTFVHMEHQCTFLLFQWTFV